jgi:hypothetical protein
MLRALRSQYSKHDPVRLSELREVFLPACSTSSGSVKSSSYRHLGFAGLPHGVKTVSLDPSGPHG